MDVLVIHNIIFYFNQKDKNKKINSHKEQRVINNIALYYSQLKTVIDAWTGKNNTILFGNKTNDIY